MKRLLWFRFPARAASWNSKGGSMCLLGKSTWSRARCSNCTKKFRGTGVYIYIYIHMICLLCIMYNRYSLYSIDIWSLYIYVNSYVYIYVYLNIDIILHYNTIHMCHGQNNWTLFLVIAGIKPWLRLFGSSWSIWDETCFCGSLSWDWLIDW